jgi:uncharacterized protein (TIGR00730 family)
VSNISNNLVAVFCSGRIKDQQYLNLAYSFSKKLAENNIGVIYGGGSRSMMGESAKGQYENNGYVVGVVTEITKALEAPVNLPLNQETMCKEREERTSIMVNKSNAVVCLPGGLGTYEEFLYSLLNSKKEIILLNSNGFFDSAIAQTETILDKFHDKNKRPENLYRVLDNIDDAINLCLKSNTIDRLPYTTEAQSSSTFHNKRAINPQDLKSFYSDIFNIVSVQIGEKKSRGQSLNFSNENGFFNDLNNWVKELRQKGFITEKFLKIDFKVNGTQL